MGTHNSGFTILVFSFKDSNLSIRYIPRHVSETRAIKVNVRIHVHDIICRDDTPSVGHNVQRLLHHTLRHVVVTQLDLYVKGT